MPGSLETRLAQLLMVGFHGPEPNEDAWSFLERTPPGGILLFKHNVTSQEGIAATLRLIQERCSSSGQPPILVGIDQEGGRVVRLTEEIGFKTFGSARSQAGEPDPETTVAMAMASTAKGLCALGINMDFAPVLDVVTAPDNRVIGDRSYGADADSVTRLGLAAIRALQVNGVAATAKHFPGHGPTAVDSHLDLPLIPLPEQAMAVHLAPFRAAVEAGVAAVMTAHAVYPAFDPDAPATLSRRILTGLLREDWGYEGVITTDSLTMQAIARRQTVPEACVQAIEAGCDLLMVPASPPLHRECLHALEAAVTSGRITEERVEQSIARTVRVRRSFPARVS